MSSWLFLHRVGFVLAHCKKEILGLCAMGVCKLLYITFVIFPLGILFVSLDRVLKLLSNNMQLEAYFNFAVEHLEIINSLLFPLRNKIIFYWYESGGDVNKYFAPDINKIVCHQQTFTMVDMFTKIKRPGVYYFQRNFEHLILHDANTNQPETNGQINIASMHYIPTKDKVLEELVSSEFCKFPKFYLYKNEYRNGGAFNMFFNGKQYLISFCDLHPVLK